MCVPIWHVYSLGFPCFLFPFCFLFSIYISKYIYISCFQSLSSRRSPSLSYSLFLFYTPLSLSYFISLFLSSLFLYSPSSFPPSPLPHAPLPAPPFKITRRKQGNLPGKTVVVVAASRIHLSMASREAGLRSLCRWFLYRASDREGTRILRKEARDWQGRQGWQGWRRKMAGFLWGSLRQRAGLGEKLQKRIVNFFDLIAFHT